MFTSLSVIPNQVNLNVTSATSPLDKANLFNQYFHSVYAPYSSTSDISSNLDSSSIPTISTILVQEEEVFNILSSLDPSKAMGADQIGPKVVMRSWRDCSRKDTSLFQI